MGYLIRTLRPELHGSVGFLESFDVETEVVVFTVDPAQALVFPDFEAVEAAWQSKAPWALRPCLERWFLVAQSVEDVKGR